MENQFVMEESMKIVNQVIKMVDNYYGKVYGEYVRDCVVTRQKDPLCPVNYKEIKVHFPMQVDWDHFKDELLKVYPRCLMSDSGCDLIVHGTKITTMFITIGDRPSFDYDVNRLHYDGKAISTCYKRAFGTYARSGNVILPSFHDAEGLLKELYENILNKKATLLECGYEKLMKGYNHHFETVKDRTEIWDLNQMIRDGWTIYYKHLIIKKVINDAWIKEYFVPLRQKPVAKDVANITNATLLNLSKHIIESQENCIKQFIIMLKQNHIFECTIEKLFLDNPIIALNLMETYLSNK